MTQREPNIPTLEDRFLQPQGWQWHYFTRDGRVIRLGSVSPTSDAPDAIVVCLPGLSEFAEKYYETARDCLGQNLAFWVIDWMGQGASGRYFDDLPHRRHSSGFEEDVADLEYAIENFIAHANTGNVPLVMLAHSMGGNIGLRYLAQNPTRFSCAAISAPMLDMEALPRLPLVINATISGALSMINPKGYVFGGGDWGSDSRPEDRPNAFSSDPVRALIHNAWCEADPRLQIGSVTFGWLYEAVKSCMRIQGFKSDVLNTPCFIGIAEKESVVRNAAIEAFVSRMPAAVSKIFQGSYHEILMEKDNIRTDFLNHFFALVKENIK